MNGKIIEEVIQKDSTALGQYRGIYESDRLPMYHIRGPSFVIANTDPHYKSGQHWVAFYFPKHGPAEYFDSAGRAPSRSNRYFVNFLKNNSNSYIYNKKTLQNPSSRTCGAYVLYYVIHRANGVSSKDILDRFNENNTLENDRNITMWINKVM